MDSELKRSSSRERGIALPIALFALVVIGGLVVLSALYGRQEQQLGRSAIKREHARAAAQEGVVAQLPVWKVSGYNRLAAGSSAAFSGWAGDGTGWYRGTVRRLNDLLFLVQGEGFSADSQALSRTGLLVRLEPQQLAVDSALTTTGGTVLRGSAFIRNEDTPPAGWACPSREPRNPAAPLPPPLDDLRLRADAVIGTGTFTIGPRSTGRRCQTTDPTNWGDPDDPGGTCGQYFPIIHAAGDITLRGGRGQGILIVHGDLALVGGVRFYGPVIVNGRLTSSGLGGHIAGGVLAASADLYQATVSGGATVTFSSCAILRAVVGSGRPSVLGERGWIELVWVP